MSRSALATLVTSANARVARSAAEYVGRMRELGLRTFRVDLLRETPAQVGPLLDRSARVFAGRDGRETGDNFAC